MRKGLTDGAMGTRTDDAAGLRPALPILLTLLALFLSSAGSADAGGDGTLTLVGPQETIVGRLPTPIQQPPGAAVERSPVDHPAPRSVAALAQAVSEGAPAANAPALAAAGTTPTVLSNKFEGLDNSDNASLTGFVVTPPDPQVAVGPNHVLEMVNIVGRIYDKKGNAVKTFKLSDFFAVPSGWLDTDPRVIYDALSGRWFATYASYINNGGTATDFARLHIAVSQTDDPTGAWNLYYIQYSDVLPDYPGVGVTSDKLTVSSNIFDIDGQHLSAGCSGGYCGEQTVVVEKADLLAGGTASIFVFATNPSRFTVRPAHSLSAVNDQYLETFSIVSGVPTTKLTLIRITGTPAAANVTEASAVDLTVLSQGDPPLSQTGGAGQIDSGDFRLLETVWRDGHLWGAGSAPCTPPGDSSVRSCAHLMEVNTASNAVSQDMMFGANGQYYSWPAIRSDSAGNLIASLTHTNSGIFAEAVVAGRLAGDPLNTMGGTALLRAGDVIHTSSRWGDYLGAAVDPTYPGCIWLVGEYAKSTLGADWGTYIGAASYGGCDGDADGWADATDNCPSWPNPTQFVPGWAILANDPDCDGFSSSDETAIGTLPLAHCAATATPNDENPDAWSPDLDDNRTVDINDVLAMKEVFHTAVPPTSSRFDLKPDGAVDIADILAMKPFFGATCA